MVYKIDIKNIFFSESNNNDKIELIDIAVSTNSILLYSFNIKHNTNSLKRRRVRNFNDLDLSLIEQKSIAIHDFSMFYDLEHFKNFLNLCLENNKTVILPMRYVPYRRDGHSQVLIDIYSYIISLKLEDISNKSIYREFKLKQLLS